MFRSEAIRWWIGSGACRELFEVLLGEIRNFWSLRLKQLEHLHSPSPPPQTATDTRSLGGGGGGGWRFPSRALQTPTEVDFQPKKFKFYHSRREFAYWPQNIAAINVHIITPINQMSNISSTSSPRRAVGAAPFGASGGFDAASWLRSPEEEAASRPRWCRTAPYAMPSPRRTSTMYRASGQGPGDGVMEGRCTWRWRGFR
jgi:hypothetical protein